MSQPELLKAETKTEKYPTREAKQAFERRVKASLQDKVKLALVSYTIENPEWTVEDLKAMLKFLERHYGLSSRRYGPPQATVGEANGSTSDPSGTDGSNDQPTG